MPSPSNHNWPFEPNYNFGVDSVFTDRIFSTGNTIPPPPPPAPGYFLLLDGTNVLLLDGTDFDLL